MEHNNLKQHIAAIKAELDAGETNLLESERLSADAIMQITERMAKLQNSLMLLVSFEQLVVSRQIIKPAPASALRALKN